jgi:two-component sensor histidine kinase
MSIAEMAGVTDEGQGTERAVLAEERAAILETRLRELEHRLTNTLQLIVALLELPARQAHPEASRALLAAAERVSALGTLYGDLVAGDEAGAIDLPHRLGEFIARQGRIAPDNIELVFASQVQRCIVPQDTALNLLIVLNELVTNALKHAFPNGRGGQVSVVLSGGPRVYSIAITDDGVGTSWSPEAFGTGLRIADGLVEHVGGGIDIVPVTSGTRIVMRFRGSESGDGA